MELAVHLILSGAVLVLFGLILGFLIFRRFRLIARLLETLHRQTPSETGEVRKQIWISNDQIRSHLFKLSPSKEVGIIILRSDKILLLSANLEEKHFTRQYNLVNLRTEWIGNQLMRDSNLQWFAIGEGDSRILVSAYTGISALSSRRETAEIYRNIAGQHEQFSGTKEFALEKNAASISMLILTALLFVYSISDGLFVNPLEIVGYPKNIFIYLMPIILVLILCSISYKLMLRFSVPARETLVLALLLSYSLLAAAIPLAKRVDTAMTTSPMWPYEYRMTKEGVFKPAEQYIPQVVEKDPPKLDLRLKCDYWKQFEDNHTFLFLLQKGGLGFWQYDGRSLDKDIDAYLDKNPEQRK
jgi:hypothetical protein